MEEMMMHGMHMWKGVGALVLGILILINVYWQVFGWWAFVGWVLVLAGLAKLLIPCCKHKKR